MIIYDAQTGQTYEVPDNIPGNYTGPSVNPGLFGRFGSGLGGLFGRLRNGTRGIFGDAKGMFSNFNNSYMNQTGNPFWSKAGGIDGLGKVANIGGAIVQGGKAIGNLSAASHADDDYENTIKDIKLSAVSNPLAMSSLDMSQKKLLRQAKSGNAKNDFGNIMNGVTRGIPDIAKNTLLGFATGGVPGAIIQGVGTAVNKGAEGYTSGTEEAQGQLQALYDRLLQSEQEYNMMKRPTGLWGSGLQSRYMNQLW